jgi:uncharacterized protein YndB with AHSA1/START domain
MNKIEKLILLAAPAGRVFGSFGDASEIARWIPGVQNVNLIQGHRSLWTLGDVVETRRDVVVEISERRAPDYIRWRAHRENESVSVEAEFTETRTQETLLRVSFEDDAQSAGATSHSSLLMDLLASRDEAEAERKLEIALAEFKDAASFAEDAPTRESTKPATPGDDLPTVEFPANTIPLQQFDNTEAAPNANNQNFEVAAPSLNAPDLDATLIRQTSQTDKNEATRNRAKPDAVSDDARLHSESAPRGIAPARLPESAHTRAGFPLKSVLLIALAFLCALALVLLWMSSRTQPGAIDSEPTVASSANTPENTSTSAPSVAAQPTASVRDTTRATTRATSEPSDAASGELQQRLTDWIAATNAADLESQMKFYAPNVERYYLRRNFSRAAVERDKKSLMERARLTNVEVEDVKINFAPDNQTATMRFRKNYGFEGRRRRDAVLQELIWRKTSVGWRIIGERDLQVVG